MESKQKYPEISDWNQEELHQLALARNSNGLIIGAPLVEPWVQPCSTIQSLSTCSSPGFGLELTKTICDRLLIICRFVFQNVTSQMDFQSNLSHSITFGDVDTTFPMLSPNPDLVVNLNFSSAIFFTEDAILIKTKFVYPTDGVFVLKPFQPWVWMGVILSLISVALLDGVCQMFHNNEKVSVKNYIKCVEQSWLYNLATLLQRSTDKPIFHMSRRFVITSWALSAMLLGGLYSGMLVSYRVAPTTVLPFKNLDDLTVAVANKNCQLLVYNPDAQFIRQIQNYPFEQYRNFHEALRINPPIFISNITYAQQLVTESDSNIVVYASQLTLESLVRINCSVSIVPLGIKRWGAYGFRRNNRINYAHLFTKIILRFLEQGYYLERLEQKYNNGRKCDEKRALNESKTDITDVEAVNLQLIFWALICGYLAGTFIFTVEKVYIGWGSYHFPNHI